MPSDGMKLLNPGLSTLGILDADLGGLSLVAAINARWPWISTVYLADTAHSPIGERSDVLIDRRLRKGVAYLNDQGAEAVLIASQSLAALAVGHANLPMHRAMVINPVELAAAAAAESSSSGRIGMIGSRATVASEAYPTAILALRPEAAVHSVAAPLLVALLDADWQHKPEARMIVKKHLHRLKVRQVDTLIMAGSRFTALGSLMQRKIGRAVRLVDPNHCTISILDQWVAPMPVPSPPLGRCRLEVTDLTPAVLRCAQTLLKRRPALDEIRI